MKRIFSLVACSFLLASLWGCASVNPNAGKPDPITGQPQPPFITNTNLTAGLEAAHGANQATAPFNPYAGLVDAALGIAALVGGGIAAFKNAQAKTATATAAQLAASVAAQPASVTQAILDHASNNEAVYPAVAGLVNQKSA